MAVYIAGIRIFNLFCSCDLDLAPMTFIYKLYPYKYELPTSRLSKVIVIQLHSRVHIVAQQANRYIVAFISRFACHFVPNLLGHMSKIIIQIQKDVTKLLQK